MIDSMLLTANEELRKENEQLIKTFKHTHEAKYVDGKLVDECKKCGLDLRHRIHKRCGDCVQPVDDDS